MDENLNTKDETPAPEKKKMPRWLKITGGIGAVAVVAIAVVATILLKK